MVRGLYNFSNDPDLNVKSLKVYNLRLQCLYFWMTDFTIVTFVPISLLGGHV